MSASEDDVSQGVWQAAQIKGWDTINKKHLTLITSHWLESQRASTDGESTLQYKPHTFEAYTFGNYICIATRGGDNAKNNLRFLYQFERTAAGDAYDLCAAGRCAGHNYDNPRWIKFPKDKYRIPDPRLVPIPAPAPAPVQIVAPVAVIIPPLEERTLSQKIQFGFS